MCGIAGFWRSGTSPDGATLAAMTNAIRLRGPGIDGHWLDAVNGVAHFFYASEPFSGRGLPPFEKGGQGGFVVGMNMKIPLGPPFSKGEVKQCNAHLRMVQRHIFFCGWRRAGGWIRYPGPRPEAGTKFKHFRTKSMGAVTMSKNCDLFSYF